MRHTGCNASDGIRCALIVRLLYKSQDDDKMFIRNTIRPTVARCLWSYLCHAALILAQHPTAEIVTTETFILKSNDCHSCARPIRADMLEVGAALRREINKAVNRVSILLYPLFHDCDVQWCALIPWQVPLPKAVSVEPPSSAAFATN